MILDHNVMIEFLFFIGRRNNNIAVLDEKKEKEKKIS